MRPEKAREIIDAWNTAARIKLEVYERESTGGKILVVVIVGKDGKEISLTFE